MRKINQTESWLAKVTKRKGDKPYDKWKGFDNRFNSWIEKKKKKILLYKMSYFPEPYTWSQNKIKLNQICLIMQQNLI